VEAERVISPKPFVEVTNDRLVEEALEQLSEETLVARIVAKRFEEDDDGTVEIARVIDYHVLHLQGYYHIVVATKEEFWKWQENKLLDADPGDYNEVRIYRVAMNDVYLVKKSLKKIAGRDWYEIYEEAKKGNYNVIEPSSVPALEEEIENQLKLVI